MQQDEYTVPINYWPFPVVKGDTIHVESVTVGDIVVPVDKTRAFKSREELDGYINEYLIIRARSKNQP